MGFAMIINGSIGYACSVGVLKGYSAENNMVSVKNIFEAFSVITA